MISMEKLRSRVELLLVLGHTGYNARALNFNRLRLLFNVEYGP